MGMNANVIFNWLRDSPLRASKRRVTGFPSGSTSVLRLRGGRPNLCRGQAMEVIVETGGGSAYPLQGRRPALVRVSCLRQA